ncbi:macro domain-containing protein [Planctomycetota bacterium]
MPAEMNVGEGTIRLIKDDITNLEIDAFVFYARHDLVLGSGFGTAITVRGGPSIQKELEKLGPLETGKAVASGAGNLKAKHIIHAVGPRFQEPRLEELLRTTMASALACAEEKGCGRVAFPAMGAGFYGVPLDMCARVMVETIRRHLEGDTKIKEVVVCIMDTHEQKQFEPEFSPVSTGKGA